jgi:UDP-N-acetylmuramate--alanine ligase
MIAEEFSRYLHSGKICHLVGIGGVSMSPLAEILFNSGIDVTGSDLNECSAISDLRLLGIPVNIGHNSENVKGAGYIIRTAAAREDNPEIMAAREQGIPVFERAQVWGHIMQSYKDAVCISGAHGKTTTTSMVSHILLAAGTDPTIMIGGTLPVLESGCHVGKGNIIVLESCEYYNSFHNFHPTLAIILNIDADHLDFFKNLDGLKQSFRKFASLVPDNGHILCNGDDENTMDALNPLGRELITFGFGEYVFGTDTPMRIRGVNESVSGRNPYMEVLFDGDLVCKIKLQIPGAHNLKNALAAAATCLYVGIHPTFIEEGLSGFTGVGRRFEYKGSYNGADIYDDYAHHPRELSALLDAVATIDSYKRVLLAFQPHTYTRTKALFSDFAEELKRPDIVFLSEIYAARETHDGSISSAILAEAVPGARCIPDFTRMREEIGKIAKDGDIVLTVGAGNIFEVGEALATVHS